MGHPLADTIVPYQSESLVEFPLMPYLTCIIFCQPAQYLSHFLGHEGAGSIHSVLKRKGWVVNLATSSLSGDRDNGFDFFRIAIILTKEGWGMLFVPCPFPPLLHY